jgi:hypothetical protein
LSFTSSSSDVFSSSPPTSSPTHLFTSSPPPASDSSAVPDALHVCATQSELARVCSRSFSYPLISHRAQNLADLSQFRSSPIPSSTDGSTSAQVSTHSFPLTLADWKNRMTFDLLSALVRCRVLVRCRAPVQSLRLPRL